MQYKDLINRVLDAEAILLKFTGTHANDICTCEICKYLQKYKNLIPTNDTDPDDYTRVLREDAANP